jgi:hypothetical protein
VRPTSIDEGAGSHRRRRTDLPASIGPVQLGTLGGWVTVCCPRDFDRVMRRAGGEWDPGARRWLIERRRIGPVIRALERDRSAVPACGDQAGS